MRAESSCQLDANSNSSYTGATREFGEPMYLDINLNLSTVMFCRIYVRQVS